MTLGTEALELLFTFASTSQVCKSFIHPKIPAALCQNLTGIRGSGTQAAGRGEGGLCN